MDSEEELTQTQERRNLLGPVLIAALIGLVVGVIVGRFFLPSGDDIEVLTGQLGVVSADLDAVGLQESNDSYDLTHASGVECLDGLERGTEIRLGLATIETGDEDTPSEAFLNSPEAEVVLWVECTTPDVP